MPTSVASVTATTSRIGWCSREATSDASGWRLPARALEQAIVQVLVAKFRDPVFPASIGADLTASEIVRVRDALVALG